MNPAPRIKLYGLLRMTRRAYIITQIVGVLVVVAILAVVISLPRPTVAPGVKLGLFPAILLTLFDLLPWLCLFVLAYQGIETYIVLGKFKKLETSGAPATPPPPPSNP
jgi:hypothetical protein